MAKSIIKNSRKLHAGPSTDPSLDNRVYYLENNVYKITYYEIISGASGSITIPTGATINADEFGLSGNCVLSEIDGSNKPTYQSPTTAGGVIVTSSLNTSTGTWVKSGTTTSTNVALIYSLNISALNYHNLDTNYIIDTVQKDDIVSQSITNGDTYHAPSGDVVFDALLGKADKQNGLVSGGAISVGTYGGTGTNNDIRVAAATWYISPSNYSTAGNTDFLDITFAATGLQRFVGFYGDSSNTITMVDGVESEYAAYPATPVGKALIGYILVTDSSAASTPDLSGYMLISSKATAADIIAGTDNAKYVTSSVMQGVVAKYQNLSTTTSTSLTTNVDGYRDTFHSVTALASAMTINAPTGTPTNGTKLWYRFKDNGTARALTWNAAFVNRGGTLPTTTILGKVHNIGLVYNSVTSTWDCVAAVTEA